MLVVPVSDSNSGAPLQDMSGVQRLTRYPVGGGVEGDRPVDEKVEDPGGPDRREMQPGSAGLPLCYRCGKESAG